MINVDYADVRTVMKDGGAALMGTGIGRGDDRAMAAAREAISSPLLDNVQIAGATGVLLNVTGGPDLTLGEVTAIADVIHDAAGDEAEIIFGAVQEPSMQGEIRVTVVATGFGRPQQSSRPAAHTSAPSRPAAAASGTPVIPIDGARPRPVIGSAFQGGAGSAVPAMRRTTPESQRRVAPDLDDLEIPTFIRRQMD